MHPTSDDVQAAIASLRENWRNADEDIAEALAESRKARAREQAKPVNPDLIRLLQRAAQSPKAPQSLRMVVEQIDAGETTWEDVFNRRGGDAAARFLSDANETARDHFDNDEVEFPHIELDPETGEAIITPPQES